MPLTKFYIRFEMQEICYAKFGICQYFHSDGCDKSWVILTHVRKCRGQFIFTLLFANDRSLDITTTKSPDYILP